MSSEKKVRQWQTRYVRLLWHFREFVKLQDQARAAKDEGMARHWWDKRTHIWKKIQKHKKNVPKGMQVEEFTQAVLKMVDKGAFPKKILEELGIKKKKSPL